MSRTHSHKNYLGRFSQERRVIEIHDHTEGECDLPPRKEWEKMLKEVRHPHILFDKYRCIWEFPESYYINKSFCGCATCTGSYDRNLDIRRERRRGKVVSQNYDTLIYDDDEEL